MDCASEEAEIRRAVSDIAGIRGLRFHLGTRSLIIDADATAAETAAAVIRRLGMAIERWPDERIESPARERPAMRTSRLPGRDVLMLVLALVLASGAEIISVLGPGGWPSQGASMLLAVAATAIAGLGVLKKGFASLSQGRLNINALMSVAVVGAFVIGQWPEAAMVMVLYSIAELIEARAVDRARNAISGLMALAPDVASVRGDDGVWRKVPAAQVAVGSTMRIRPGERVPLDGMVVHGDSTVDQAPVTGESVPVDKAPGDAVFAGTINQSATMEVRTTASASNSTIARIIEAVERAQGSRAPMQRFVDRFAAVYTPAVFVLSVVMIVAGPWLFGWEWLDAIYRALVLLVIACPCALVISTPVTIVSGLAAAARRGVVIKGGAHLERARLLRAVAFDKTGTVTVGKPSLVGWSMLDPDTLRQDAEHLAYALANHSDHPVSRAVAAGLNSNHVEPADFRVLAGRGVEAHVAGRRYVLGNHRLIEERGQCSPAIEALLGNHEAQGRTVSLLASDVRVIAAFAVADTIKVSSAQAIRDLRAQRIPSILLTGDNQTTAEAIAREVGIVDVRGNLLPEEKLAAIDAIRATLGPVGMVGDGINDAPALAQADIGIAMGAAGTDIAMEAADIVVMNDDLRSVAETIRLSRNTHTVLWQNIALALGIKAIFLILAVQGSASMWMAVFADMGASLIVVFNGLRLLRVTHETPPQKCFL